MKAYHLNSHAGAGRLARVDVSKPAPASHEVRIRVEAVSLNYRDLITLDRAGQNEHNGRVPLSRFGLDGDLDHALWGLPDR